MEPDGRSIVDLGRGVSVDLAEITWKFSTSGGPGGQHVNTSRTKAEALFDVAGSSSLPQWARERIIAKLGAVVAVSASDTRSQARNRDLALGRLIAKLATSVEEPKHRTPTRPTASARRRRLEAKRMLSGKKLGRRPNAGLDDDR